MTTRHRDLQATPEPEQAGRPEPAPEPHGAPELLIAMQRSAGNAATGRWLAREPEGATAVAEPAAEQEAGEPQLAPEEKKTEPEHPTPPKLQMDLASGEKVLTNAFGSVKTIVAGKVEILEPAAFKAAYDKIYGKTQWSWDKYVVPTYGSLNGFADKSTGTNYINKGSAGLHTVVHEMLHNNVAADWLDVVGSRWDEGSTEVLTQEACKKLSVDAPVTYPGESPVVREAMASGLKYEDLVAAYLSGAAKEKVAGWVDKSCKENWAAVKAHMEAKDWAAAKAGLAKKA